MTPSANCTVVGNGKSVAASGGHDSLCAEVERAIASRAPGVPYTAEIRVLSPSRLAATLLVNGHALPVQNFAVMDGTLGEHSIKQFADSLAKAVAEAAGRRP